MKRMRYLAGSLVACIVLVGVSAGQVKQPPIKVPTATKAFSFAPSSPQRGMIVENPRARVSTAEELASALQAAANAKNRCEIPYIIWVEDNASIDLDAFENLNSNANYLLQIPSCVTLVSGRSATQSGALLYLKRRLATQLYAFALENAARVSGLRLQGPYGGSDAGGNQNAAILIKGDSQALVDNNEIFDWPHAAVEVSAATNDQGTAQQIEVRGNFIHDNVVCGSGYGVVIGGAGYAYIDKNLFDFNRHAVSDDGCVAGQGSCAGNTGYIAELNFVLSGGRTCPSSGILGSWASYYNQHFDVHGLGSGCGSTDHCGGLAGQYVDIRYNAIRGDQGYDIVKTRPAFELRGTPAEAAYFRDNAVAHQNQGDAISTPANSIQAKLYISNVQYKTDTSNELAVGDFDGDGAADIFQATGQVWVYSPRGQREWRYLNQSSIRLSGLAFGDFDGDGKTDVFTQEGDKWLVSYGGVGPWTPLPAGSNIPMSSYGFADFDGDGKTDIFESNGKEWFYSSGGATPWKHLNYSTLGIRDIRFGHFNPKDLKKTDVFAVVNGEWSVSYGGVSKWEKLNDKLSDSVDNLVFADFNGDGITDIAYSLAYSNVNSTSAKPTWYVSWSGRSPWQVLNTWNPGYTEMDPPLSQMLIGDFNGDKHADVILQQKSSDFQMYFFWSSSGTEPLTQRSPYTVQ